MKPTLTFKSLIPFALVAVTSTGALAEGAEYTYPQAWKATTSRADVQSQAIGARAAGQVVQGQAQIEAPTAGPSTVSRQQVRAEAIEARRLGLVANGDGPIKEPSAAELERVRRAGLRAQPATQYASR